MRWRVPGALPAVELVGSTPATLHLLGRYDLGAAPDEVIITLRAARCAA